MKIEYSQRISKVQDYPFAKINKKVKDLKNKGVKVIDFGIGDPKSKVPDFIIDELYKSAKNTQGYPSYIGEDFFRKACSIYMKKRFNVNIDPKLEISITGGTKEGVFNFPIGFINKGDIVICPSPSYPVYKIGTEFAGGIPYITPLLQENNFLIDFKSIPKDICQKAKIIWINYPNSPTAVSAPSTWLKDLIEWAEKYNIIIASDEGCYIDIYFNKKPHSILEFKKEGIVAFYSLSKRNNMTGYRIGFIAGDEKIINGFKKVKTNIDSGVPIFIQKAASIALNDDKHVELMRSEYREKRDILIPVLKNIGEFIRNPDSTFYLWLKTKNGESDIELASKLIDIGIVVTPGSLISDVTSDGYNPGFGFVRFALVPSINAIKEAKERILKNLS